jgi:hypothetical protein
VSAGDKLSAAFPGHSLDTPADGRRITDKGYVEVRSPAHPLANKDGWVAEHRLVLYNHNGAHDQPCYWCGWVLPWRADGYKTCVNVDHLNERRDDNDVRNLVPSCWNCNVNRSWSRVAPTMWRRYVNEHAHLDPNERPSSILWLAAQAEPAPRTRNVPLRRQPPLVDPSTGRAILGGRARRRTA